MTCTTVLQRWKLLSFLILLTLSELSSVECSYSVRDDEGCQETSCNTCASRSPACTVNYSSRGGATHRWSGSELQRPGRLPRPAAWLLVALLSALAGATACWIVNLLAPPPGYRRKTNTKHSTRAYRLPTDTSRAQQSVRRQEPMSQGDQQQAATGLPPPAGPAPLDSGLSPEPQPCSSSHGDTDS